MHVHSLQNFNQVRSSIHEGMWILTDLIPGRFNRVPTTGTLRKKFMATGKNPLKFKKRHKLTL